MGNPQIEPYTSPAYPGEGEPALLREVTTETYDDYTRVIFRFESTPPEFRLEYVPTPVLSGPSGDEIQVAGEVALLVSMAPASGFDMRGTVPAQVFAGPSRVDLDGPIVKELVQANDSNGQLTWAIGLDEQLPFGFASGSDNRLVIDVHPAEMTPVAAYDGERAFAVEAFVTPTEACVAIRADRATTECVPTENYYPFEHRLVHMDDMAVMVGIVYDPHLVDIDLVTRHGSVIAEDSEDFALVEIGNGLRAFAPAIDPANLLEIKGLGADGTVILQAQVQA